MTEELYKINIDLGELPEYVGRANNGRIDYRYNDVPAIKHEIDQLLRWHPENVCADITGVMPSWLAMDIAVIMHEKYIDEKIDMFRYVTPNMIENDIEPYVIFPKGV